MAEAAGFEPPRFGTDGIRGLAGVPPLDPETLRRVGAALGLWLQRSGPDRKRVVIGNDGRESAGWILEALAQGLTATETTAVDIGLCTTPALAYLARSPGFAAGIMISASHNPAADNGIKIFDASGDKLDDAAEREIAALTARLAPSHDTTPRVREDADLLIQYVEHLANAFPALDLEGVTVAVDAANGGGCYLAPDVLRGLGADVVRVACEPDGNNINDGCGALHPEHLVETVRASGATLGICLDGDGDRGIFVDDRGRIRDGDDVLVTLGTHLHRTGALPHATVVTTVMTNLAAHRALRAAGVRVEVTPVGDRHVTQRMRAGGFALGAEQSGHVAFDGAGAYTGDGLFTALRILALPGVGRGGSAGAFVDFERFPQRLVNVAVTHKPPLDGVAPIQVELARARAELGDDGRVVLRYSGTENLCRVMVEGPSEDVVARHTDRLVEVVRGALGGD